MRISDWSSDVCSSDLTITNNFSATVTGGEVVPTTALALANAAAAIKEDSENNVVEFNASADNATDELTSIVIELPGVAGGDVDITPNNTALIGIGSASVTERSEERRVGKEGVNQWIIWGAPDH